jgi:hypothetical protein
MGTAEFSAKRPIADTAELPSKQKGPPRGGPSEMRLDAISQSGRAVRQAGAGPEGEVRLFLRCARSDLQRRIGDFEGKYLLFSLLNSHRDARHGVVPFCGCRPS